MSKRWWVEVWATPPGSGRYRDAHPEHRERLEREGKGKTIYCGTVESVGKVSALGREYRTARGAERYAAELRELWGDRYLVEVVTGYTLGIDI